MRGEQVRCDEISVIRTSDAWLNVGACMLCGWPPGQASALRLSVELAGASLGIDGGFNRREPGGHSRFTVNYHLPSPIPYNTCPFLTPSYSLSLTTSPIMADYNQPYDPYIPSGNSSSNPSGAGRGAQGGNAKTAHIQAQIDETVGVMRDNINKVNERGENLNSLQDKTGTFFRPTTLCIGTMEGTVRSLPPTIRQLSRMRVGQRIDGRWQLVVD